MSLNNYSLNAGRVSWVSPKLGLQTSMIEGLGYFAEEKIEKDEPLIVQGGRCVHVTEMDNPGMEPCWYVGFQIERDVYLCPFEIEGRLNLDGIFVVNHSCNPNAGFSGQVSLVAMREIHVGEEVTFDYAMTDLETDDEDAWNPEQCRCGQQQCRKLITGNDWRNKELHDRYSGYFSSHIAGAISKADF